MSKLVAEKGQINKVAKWEAGPMSVVFRRAALAPNGDAGQVLLICGNDRVEITYAQAISFANEVLRRCQ